MDGIATMVAERKDEKKKMLMEYELETVNN